jgi:hypothetical protein
MIGVRGQSALHGLREGLEWKGHYVDILKGEQFDPAYQGGPVRRPAGGGGRARPLAWLAGPAGILDLRDDYPRS